MYLCKIGVKICAFIMLFQQDDGKIWVLGKRILEVNEPWADNALFSPPSESMSLLKNNGLDVLDSHHPFPHQAKTQKKNAMSLLKACLCFDIWIERCNLLRTTTWTLCSSLPVSWVGGGEGTKQTIAILLSITRRDYVCVNITLVFFFTLTHTDDRCCVWRKELLLCS